MKFEDLENKLKESKERNVSIREAADLLQKGEISVVDYVQGMEKAIGKQRFWEIYNKVLEDYFKGIDFSDTTIKDKLIEEQESGN